MQNASCPQSNSSYTGVKKDQKSISNQTITFLSCRGDVYSYHSDLRYKYGRLADVEKKLLSDCTGLTGTKPGFQQNRQLWLPTQSTNWNRSVIEAYFKNKDKLKPIEGVYQRAKLTFEDEWEGKYFIAIIENSDDEGYLIVYLAGAGNRLDWEPGELKGIAAGTANPLLFTVDWVARDKSIQEDVFATLESSGLLIYSTGVFPLAQRFVKVLPIQD